jgi:hypothetical protein
MCSAPVGVTSPSLEYPTGTLVLWQPSVLPWLVTPYVYQWIGIDECIRQYLARPWE